MMPLTVKRVYDPPAPGDGTRILVDRLWPRGVAKDRIDLWLKDLAPSDALRHEFHGHPERWDEFCAAYATELGSPSAEAALATLAANARGVRSPCSTRRRTRIGTTRWPCASGWTDARIRSKNSAGIAARHGATKEQPLSADWFIFAEIN